MSPRTAPGRETPDSPSLCPPWCAAQDRADHWQEISTLWQACHERHFGEEVMVGIPQEIYGSGAKPWVGQPEVIIESKPDYSPDEAENLARRIQEAAAFTRRMQRNIASSAALGKIDTDVSVPDDAAHTHA